MNRIIKSNLDEFSAQFSISQKTECDQYEYFSGYCILSKYLSQETITSDYLRNINIGNGNDWGIDNIIVIINNHLVCTLEELHGLTDNGQSLNVKIVLIQAKTSDSIDSGEFAKFTKGARDILAYLNGKRDTLPPANQKLEDKLKMLDKLYSHGAQFSSENEFSKPRYHLFYITTGETDNDANINSMIAQTKDDVDKSNLVDDFHCSIITASKICDLYRNTKKSLSCVLEVVQELKMPKVDEIVESHLCLLPFSEFRKLIIDKDDHIIKSIFEDNVRDFQGDNSVNQAIGKTIRDGRIKLFTALNNGITIIARKMSYVGTSMTLDDYQIVNGCQTCHVLYENRNAPGINDLTLSVKIISSTDRDIRDRIVVANNSQTEVKSEQLTSLLQVQRKIEMYYQAQERFTKLYYERRSKQYRYGQEKIPAGHVITIPYQIMAYVSMVLGEPHLTSNYYGKIIEQFNGENDSRQIFDSKANPAFYYMSALAAYFRDKWLDSSEIDRNLRHVKHHLLYALRLVVTDKDMPALNSNKAQAYCDGVCEILCDKPRGIEAFRKAGKLIIDTLGREPEHNDLNDKSLATRISQYYNRNLKKKISTLNPETTYIPTEVPSLEHPKVIGKIDLEKLSRFSRSAKKKV